MQLGPIGTNCYIVRAEGSNEALVVDPGGDVPAIVAALNEHELLPVAVLVTHCHWDHIGGVAEIAEELQLPVYMAAAEAHVLADLDTYAPEQFGPWRSWDADNELHGGEMLQLAGIELAVLSLPGHSPAHLGYLIPGVRSEDDDEEWETPPILLSGDVLFQGSVGRTDLPGADHATLQATLQRMADTLDPATLILSGHGGVTTLGHELETNPFLVQV